MPQPVVSAERERLRYVPGPHHDASVVGLSYIDDPFSVGIRYHYLSPVAGNRVLGLCRFDIHDRRYQYGE